MKKDIVQFPMIKLLLDRAQIHNSEAMRRCALEYLWGTFRKRYRIVVRVHADEVA